MDAAVLYVLLGEDDGDLLFVMGGHLFHGKGTSDGIVDVGFAHAAHHAVHPDGDADHEGSASFSGEGSASESGVSSEGVRSVAADDPALWHRPAMAHPAQ